jgi:hypothetical protein
MVRATQLGVALGALGFVLALMGLFPGVTGIIPGRGVGAVQFLVVWVGFFLLVMGAIIYVKYAFYPRDASNLAQQVGIRLAWTGLILTGMSGLADFLGFGSQIPSVDTAPVFGELQLLGVVGGFLMAALGVMLYAITGMPRIPKR